MNFESYPPPFRQPPQNSYSENYTTSHTSTALQDSDFIPTIDLQCLNQLDNKLEDACKNWGLFRLVNHGVPPTLLSQLQDHAKKLFSLSFESKQALFTSPLSYFWGTPALSPSGTALLKRSQDINWVEGLNVPLGQLSQIQPQDFTLASFRVLLEEYRKHLARVARALFDSMLKNLNLDTIESKSNLSESNGSLRVYRYPYYSNADSAWGMDVHTDSSVLSILNQDEVGGLEVLKDDQWFTVKPIPNTLIVNLGDMMQAISDDEYKSVKHRVKVNKYKERLSICYFVFPEEGSVIRSLKYKPFTYSDFQAQVQQDIKTLGHKVGLDRFKLITND
ncbi:hypothetical protein FNV43_RR04412 [Rhamnella rubrinervis]|uniref:Fe2OG dioxygenase domain-containing protein n=1 Tax=Rhamnella rubrinervis TaxID=2594499 RepID=A0A8K0HK87_9ROSA|nr:hypothetical protein FNV43_RR04412 [Rhamnella rubrinervis]